MLSRRKFIKKSALVAAISALTLQAKPSFAKSEMSLQKAIFTRRSIRKYTEEKVSQEQIDFLLKAAMQAPSGGGDEPWEFLVVTDREKLKTLPTIKTRGVNMAKDAPLGILTCYDKNLESKNQVGFAVQSVSCASQNILLAAHSIGLGAVWTSAYPNEEFVDIYRNLFNLPENIVPVAFIVIGHPNEEKTPNDYFKPERVHTNVW